MSTRARSTLGRIALLVTILIALVVSTQSCIFDNTGTTLCPSGRRCPSGWTCAAIQDICISNGCGNGIIEQSLGEVCDDGNVTGNDNCSIDCKALGGCGNGQMDSGEACDDYNNISGDGCSADCLSDETCPNGYRDMNEACDDGNAMGGDGCSADCRFLETCGDNIRDPGEVCDDGNRASGDGCSYDCLSNEICGNAYADVDGREPEECDVGPAGDATCDVDCSFAECGDGTLNPEFINPDTGRTESCDDGDPDRGPRNTDACDADCSFAKCGDGFFNPRNTVKRSLFSSDIEVADHDEDKYFEECDDGNDVNTDECLEGCKVAICGDGFKWEGEEECDDGEADNSDTIGLACRTSCTLPICGDAVVDDGFRHGREFDEECDDGIDNSDTVPLACRPGCRLPMCGDGVTDDGNRHGRSFTEECDDGNTSNDDACVTGCKEAKCGDGFIHVGEEDCETDADCIAQGLVSCIEGCRCA